MNFRVAIVSISLSIFLLIQCNKTEDRDPAKVYLPDGSGYATLSEYNFFEGEMSDGVANSLAGVLPYDLNTPLFSDYALKERFVYVPSGSIIPFDTTKVLDLPVGSALIKNFYYLNADGSKKYIETRLLLHRADGWHPEDYEWNESQTEATRSVVGGTRTLTTMVDGQETTFSYLIPNSNQCTNCHANEGDIEPIGPAVHNLNKDYSYPDGTMNQLDKWIANGLLSNSSLPEIPQYPKFDDLSADLNDRARAYLAVNCASCHRLEGSAANSGLYLGYHATDSLGLGFYKTPVAAGAGSGGLTYVINPGNADESILLYRMIADEVDERMPEIGRELPHAEGIDLIREWIDAM